MTKIVEVFATTGETVEREPTADELKQMEIDQAVWSANEDQRKKDEVDQKRRSAYQLEADPLFFGWQRGENTEQVWLDKVAEIRARHPYSD